jgi:GNAT superfamily N-acetyltransferase
MSVDICQEKRIACGSFTTIRRALLMEKITHLNSVYGGRQQSWICPRGESESNQGTHSSGFAELESDGHIDYFYCDHEYVRKGVGRKLYEAVEIEAKRLQLPRLHAAVSVTANPFFLRMGFEVLKEHRNVSAVAMNCIMENTLTVTPG